MPKGKKFDSAEKNFEKQRIQWRQKVRCLEQQLQEELTKTFTLTKTVQELKKENEQLKQTNQKLMKLVDLTPEQVQQLAAESKLAATLNSVFNMTGR